MSKSTKHLGLLYPLVLYLIAPLGYTIAKFGFAFGPSIFLIGSSLMMGGFFIYLSCYKRKRIPFNWQDKVSFILTTVGGIGAYIPFFWALRQEGIGKISIIFLTVPLFIVALEYCFGLVRMSTNKFLGVIIGIGGIVPMLIYESPTEISFILDKVELAVLLACFGYSVGFIGLQLLIDRGHSLQLANSLRMMIGGAGVIAGYVFIENWAGGYPHVLSWKFFLFYVVLVAFFYSVRFLYQSFLLKYFSAGFISVCGFLEPLIAVLYAAILFNERISFLFFPCLAVSSIGLYIYYKEELRVGKKVST